MKHSNLGIVGYWIIWAGYQIEKDMGPNPVLQMVQKIPGNYCPSLHLSIDQV